MRAITENRMPYTDEDWLLVDVESLVVQQPIRWKSHGEDLSEALVFITDGQRQIYSMRISAMRSYASRTHHWTASPGGKVPHDPDLDERKAARLLAETTGTTAALDYCRRRYQEALHRALPITRLSVTEEQIGRVLLEQRELARRLSELHAKYSNLRYLCEVYHRSISINNEEQANNHPT